MLQVTARSVPTSYGDVRVFVYASGGTHDTRATTRRPALVWSHGGAWALGSLDMPEADNVARRFAAAIDGVVVSVDYSLVPAGARHPRPVEEIAAVFDWVVGENGGLGVAPGRVAVGGASAGAHLSACAALALRDSAAAVPAAVVLAYPAVDPDHGPYGERPHDVPSELWLDQGQTSALFAAYMDGAHPTEVPAVPMRADLAGLPPTLVTTAGRDGLRLQGEMFVTRLADAGVVVEHHDEPRKYHGYLNNESASCNAAIDRHAAWLRAALSR
jgi:acetyl esterase